MSACNTGDDFNYAELIEGDAQCCSDALLGIFDAIAPAAGNTSRFTNPDLAARRMAAVMAVRGVN